MNLKTRTVANRLPQFQGHFDTISENAIKKFYLEHFENRIDSLSGIDWKVVEAAVRKERDRVTALAKELRLRG